MKNKIIGLIFSSLLLFSCSKVIEVDFDKLEMKEAIVVQSYLSSDGVIAYINKSLLLNNIHGDNYLKPSSVWLYKNGLPYAELFEKEKSMYITPDTLTIDKNSEYNLVVEAKGFETAISNIDRVINKVTIDTVYNYFDSTNWAANLYINFIDNNVDDNNGYLIKAFLYRKDTPNEHELVVDIMDDEGYVFNKRRFHENYYRRFDSAVIEISTYSKVLIDFDNSLGEYEVSYGDIEFETVYPVMNSIENGFGFFAAKETSSITITKE